MGKSKQDFEIYFIVYGFDKMKIPLTVQSGRLHGIMIFVLFHEVDKDINETTICLPSFDVCFYTSSTSTTTTIAACNHQQQYSYSRSSMDG